MQETTTAEKTCKSSTLFFLYILHFCFLHVEKLKRYFAILAVLDYFYCFIACEKKRKWKFLHVTRVMLHNFSKNYVSLFLRSGKQWNLFLFSSSFAYCRCAAACRAHAILCECMFNWLYETFMNIIFFVLRKAKAVK